MSKKEGKILIIDDNKEVLTTLKLFLQYEFEEVTTLKNPNQIPEYLWKNNYDVILLDMNFSAGVSSGNEGIYWFNEIRKYDTDVVIVFITAYADVSLAVNTIKQGAFDFVMKPWDNDKLIATLKAAFTHCRSLKELKNSKNIQKTLDEDLNKPFSNIIGTSKSIKQVFSIIEKVAQTDANILLIGENGTGKELFARDIHRLSKRKDKIFLNIDMNTLSDSLFESELFGHVKGAFTDAKENRAGRFETASEGSLFLDEIGNLPLHLQSKLLTVLENREFVKVGESKPQKFDVRLICATNKNIEQLVFDGLFREDLLYRINTIKIEIPPLRKRSEDIVLIANHYLKIYSSKYEKGDLKFNQLALLKLKEHQWPGNIRELKHTIEKAVILSNKQLINETDLQLTSTTDFGIDLHKSMTLDEIEKHVISKTLIKHNGNLTKTAIELGIIRQTLYNKIKKYGI
ncbi:MAG: sigma-54 dependent transcriptional regulator [Bacteroidales bacterium]|nr:sigma-54 dependent transcriptional regulator [Bacteroidales bacterium]